METVSRSWITGNLEKYNELLERRHTECPVCYESFAQQQAASPLLSDIPSKCTHFLCKECWQKIAKLDAECPTCREDLSPWLVQESDNRLTNEEVQKFLVSVMCIQGVAIQLWIQVLCSIFRKSCTTTNFLKARSESKATNPS